MVKKKSGMIRFIVQLKDGSMHRMEIDTFTLRTGDHIARIIARERQTGGQIPPGEIVEVRRARHDE